MGGGAEGFRQGNGKDRTDRTHGKDFGGVSQANMRTGLQKTGNRIIGQAQVFMRTRRQNVDMSGTDPFLNPQQKETKVTKNRGAAFEPAFAS